MHVMFANHHQRQSLQYADANYLASRSSRRCDPIKCNRPSCAGFASTKQDGCFGVPTFSDILQQIVSDQEFV